MCNPVLEKLHFTSFHVTVHWIMFLGNIYWMLAKLYGREFEFEACDFSWN